MPDFPDVIDLDPMVLGNSMLSWLIAGSLVVALLLAARILRWLIEKQLSRLAARIHNDFDDWLVAAAGRTRMGLLLLPALYLGGRPLELPDAVETALAGAATIGVVLQVGLWCNAMLALWIERTRSEALSGNVSGATHLGAMSFVVRFLLWSALTLLALDNLGMDITALIAGLGVGGIAVALAVQNILGDLFASLSIVLDKPFEVGDFIIVDSYLGTVENVGLKTTRVRSLGGEQLVFANSDLLGARVRNYKRMRERRIVFAFGVLYQTTPEQLEKIPSLVRSIIESQNDVRFDRAHFKGFGESAYDFEVVYWMLNPDYNLYMDTQQAINLELVRAFAQEGVDFAYPTRTLYVNNPPEQA